jgi:hypothetical protein
MNVDVRVLQATPVRVPLRERSYLNVKRRTRKTKCVLSVCAVWRILTPGYRMDM